jgi:transcriptional regulator with XRE-family HTH domain
MRPEQIRALRERLKMTQEEFARRLGLETRGAVSRLESGSRAPTGPLLAFLLHLAEETERADARS